MVCIKANITNVSFGAMFGWLLITSDGLQTRDRTHLAVQPITDQELSWVVSVFFLAAFIGSAYISWMADGYGKKHTLCHLAIAHFVSELLIYLVCPFDIFYSVFFLAQLGYLHAGNKCDGNVCGWCDWRLCCRRIDCFGSAVYSGSS